MSFTTKEMEKLAGSTVVAGFDGTSLPRDLNKRIEGGAVGGVILFKRNVESAQQVASLLDEVRSSSPKDGHTLTAVDQEGGRVVRIKEPLTHLPPARNFGEIDDQKLTETAGRLVGQELSALGFTVDFAPVMDIDTNPQSPVIGDRSFGPTADIVIRHGLAFARGLLKGGVNPCAKHFPGHGDTKLDSHLALPYVDSDKSRLEKVEMQPFARWAREEAGPIMTAHVIYQSLDPKNPATTSRAIVHGELRERLGFKGAVFSDDLEMGAVSQAGGPAEAAIKAMMAGVDGLLVCRHPHIQASVIEALAKRAVDDQTFANRLSEASKRLLSLEMTVAKKVDFEWIGSNEHNSLKKRVADGLRNKD